MFYCFVDSTRFYVQKLHREGRSDALHLVAIDDNSNIVIFNHLYTEDEGTGLAPLNTKEQDLGFTQWTGTFLKNKPAIITGLTSITFGCPVMYFLQIPDASIGINCDNRH